MRVELTGGVFGAALGAALVLGVLLLATATRERSAVRNSLVVLAVAAFVALIAAAAESVPGAAQATQLATEIAVLVVGLVLVRFVVMLVFRVAVPATGAAPPRIVGDLTTAGGYVLWAFVWLRLVGMDLTSVMTGSAIVTAAVAFSMQDTLGNVLGGVLLQLDDSIQEGDWVRVDDFWGRVTQVRWRHTTFETTNGERVVVPNAWLLKNRFTVAGSAGAVATQRRWIRLPVDLASAPGDVVRVLGEAVTNAEINRVEAKPAPDVVLMEVGPRSATYAIRYWMREPWHNDATDSAVRIHALAALARNGMKLGATYIEQFTIRDDEDQRRALQDADHQRRVRALSEVDIFKPLSDAERESLAPHLRYAPFVAGDVMTRQGAVAHWLYLIISGTAEVTVDTPDGRTHVGDLGPGAIFGEMGLLTGAPRRATVTARSDVICYRLDKAGFESIVHGRPDVAESISRVLSERSRSTDDRLALAHAVGHNMHHDDILEKVRRFFGLGDS